MKTAQPLFLALALALMLATAIGVVRAETPDAAIVRVQKAYEEIRDIRGTFTQKSVIRDLNKTETYHGEFFIKPPARMKWAYGGKTGQDLYITKETVTIFRKSDQQAFRGKFDRATYGQTPVALLSGFGSIREEFNVSGTGDTLLLTPKKPMGSVASVRVTLAPEGFPIRSFVINDTRKNVIEIELRDVRTNTGLRDALFEPNLPKGTNIIEQ